MADEDKSKSEDELKAEFRKIAERRVRLGLVLSEFGRTNNVQVTQDELNRAVVAQARQYPGQEKRIFEIYRNNPDAVAQLRAPIFEDKVVDLLVGQVKINDRQVKSRRPVQGSGRPREDFEGGLVHNGGFIPPEASDEAMQ